MAPIKFEDNIREKLQDRELTPSKDAWSKLSAQLEKEPQKKKNRFVWFAVAASFVGVLLLVNFLMIPRDGIDTNKMAEEELLIDPTVENDDAKLPVLNEQQEQTTIVENSSDKEEIKKEILNREMQVLADVETKTTTTEDKTEVKISEKTSELINNEELTTEVANIVTKNDKLKETTQDPLIKTQPDLIETGMAVENNAHEETQFINGKIDEVVAQVQDMQNNNDSVTAEEVDALLKKAQRDIATNRILNRPGNKVNAAALLNDVESELERTFRDRVFEALGDGYYKVRTAVVERNN